MPGLRGAVSHRFPGARGTESSPARSHLPLASDLRCNYAMNARLIRIGNSQGVRLPKTAIEEAGLADEIELIVRKGSITLRPRLRRREGWAKAAAECHARGDDAPLLGDFPNDFDGVW